MLRPKLLHFAFKSERLKFARIPYKRFLQLALLGVTAIALPLRAWWLAIIGIGGLLILGQLYRWARKAGYTTFIPTPFPPSQQKTGNLEPNENIELRGTGRFLVGEVERQLILISGKCWLLPVGDVATMFEAAPGRFVYHFINPKKVDQLNWGNIWFGNEKEVALQVTFQTDWIADSNQITMGWGRSDDEPLVKTAQRTLILSFNRPEDGYKLWATLKQNPLTL